jgi:hypothetical protein
LSDVDLMIRGGRVEAETRNAAIGGVTTMIPTLLNREDASV